MKILYALLLLVFSCSIAAGQTMIQGQIQDSDNQPVPGVNIILLGTYDGSTTDVSGKYEFETTETGMKTLVIKFVGYKELHKQVNLDDKKIIMDATLQEEINQLDAVTITAGSFTAGETSRRTVLKPLDIVTTAGATADIAGVLNTLPGTQKVGEQGRLFVRGGEGNETRTFIDGMVVMEAYGAAAPNTPSRGRFLPFMFKGTSFSTGGYSAEYGQALSSALVLDSKDEDAVTRTDVGLLSVGADIAHTRAWDGGSAAGKIQYTNIRPYYKLLDQEIDWKTPPASIEGVAAFRQQVGKTGMVKLYGNFNEADFSLYNHTIDDDKIRSLYDLTNRYRYLNGSYKDALNENWSIRSGVSYTSIRNDLKIDDMIIDETERGLHAKTAFEGSLSNHLELKAGGEFIVREYDQIFSGDSHAAENHHFNEYIGAAFAETDIFISNDFVTRTGVRLEYNNLTSSVRVDPRISMAYKTGDAGQVSLAYGHFRQSPKNEWLKLNTALAAEQAQHYILNYQRIENNKTFRIETYYKRYSDLVKFGDDAGTMLTNNGSGYARGIELFWRDNETIPALDYWISYSFLDTERDYLNFPQRAVPSFASAHNFSAVGKYFINTLNSQVGLTYSFASGRPYHDPNQEKFNGARTPAYHDISLNLSYLPKPYIVIHFSCTNLAGFDNVFGYEYSNRRNDQGQYNGRAIRQSAKRFIFLGVFITLARDKSMNVLPSL